jgi:hypothetical protein
MNTEAVKEALRLLYYATEIGKAGGPELRDPIITANNVIASGQPLSPAQESAFLGAYSQLSALVSPVTAKTLRASEKSYLPIYFGIVALITLLFIGIVEGYRLLVSLTNANVQSFEKLEKDLSAVTVSLTTTSRQLNILNEKNVPLDPVQAVLKENLERQRDEIIEQQNILLRKSVEIEGKLSTSFAILEHPLFSFWLKEGELFRQQLDRKQLFTPISELVEAMLAGSLIPILYGLLGACVYILRIILNKVSERSFDDTRKWEFVLRIFLGTLSGVVLHWLFVGNNKQIPGGVTPAVLAFMGGYSVELLFTTIDRMLTAIKDFVKSPPSSPAALGGPPAAPGGPPAALGGPPAAPGGPPAAPGGQPAAPGGPPAAPGGQPAAPGGPPAAPTG